MQRLMVRAPFFLSKLCLPHIRASTDGRGAIGHLASAHAHMSGVTKASHNITKFALRGLGQSIASEGEVLIRSFTVSTWFVKTPLTLNQIPDQAEKRGISPEEVVTQVMRGQSRVKELMDPMGIANLFIFGIFSFSRFLVGGDLLFDGAMVRAYGAS